MIKYDHRNLQQEGKTKIRLKDEFNKHHRTVERYNSIDPNIPQPCFRTLSLFP